MYLISRTAVGKYLENQRSYNSVHFVLPNYKNKINKARESTEKYMQNRPRDLWHFDFILGNC